MFNDIVHQGELCVFMSVVMKHYDIMQCRCAFHTKCCHVIFGLKGFRTKDNKSSR